MVKITGSVDFPRDVQEKDRSISDTAISIFYEIKSRYLTSWDYLVIVYFVIFITWLVSTGYYVFKHYLFIWTCDKDALALHKATYRNDTRLAIKICKSNPSAINQAISDDRITPFLLACLNCNTELVRFMIASGADLNSCAINGENCFLLAVCNRIDNMTCTDASCLHALYHAGADINKPHNCGLNAVQIAAMRGHISLVRWLLSKNANVSVNPSPYTLAKLAGHHRTAGVLRNLQCINY